MPAERQEVYPACAGIDLVKAKNHASGCGLPRMRGDRPSRHPLPKELDRFTPHARGSTGRGGCRAGRHGVYPACAGSTYFGVYFSRRFSFTPHARGSTLLDTPRPLPAFVYPACAGIDPIKIAENPCAPSLPRMRGDRPPLSVGRHLPNRFTPHARGSTLKEGKHKTGK